MSHRLTRPLIFLSLILFVVTMTGCDKNISLRFYNHTDDSIDLELNGPHDGDDEIGKIPPYGYYRYDFTVSDREFPAHFELEADEDVDFTVNKHTPGTLYIDLLDDKTIGPNRKRMQNCRCRGCSRHRHY